MFVGLQFLQGDINGNAMLLFGLQSIQDLDTFEGALSHLSSFFLKLLDSSFVNSTTYVGVVASWAGLARFYVSNDDNANVSLFFACFCGDLVMVFTAIVF